MCYLTDVSSDFYQFDGKKKWSNLFFYHSKATLYKKHEWTWNISSLSCVENEKHKHNSLCIHSNLLYNTCSLRTHQRRKSIAGCLYTQTHTRSTIYRTQHQHIEAFDLYKQLLPLTERILVLTVSELRRIWSRWRIFNGYTNTN